jgi:hypothetical protein
MEDHMERSSFYSYAVLGLLIGLGIVIAGFAVGNGISRIRTSDRFVSVRGLAEREVNADLAIWPISFDVTGNDLADLQRKVEEKRGIVSDFLHELGFAKEEISHSAPKIRDNEATPNYESKTPTKFRYTARTIVLLRSVNVKLVKQAMEKSGALVGKGVVLSAENWENRTEFLFTGLNNIKPAMIEEATINARSAAEKFAKDSGSKIGKIRSATQGLFSIDDRDMNSPEVKKVRVVTTVGYYLIDD